MKKVVMFVFFVLFLSSSVLAATLHGTIYDLDLTLATGAIVTIDTIPEQRYVATEGDYSFEVPLGEYTLSVSYAASDGDYSGEERITIVSEGTFRTDVILFPEFLEENFEIDQLVSDVSSLEEEKAFFDPLLIVTIVLLVLIGFFFFRKKKTKPVDIDDDLLPQVLSFIVSEGGRITQREIRKKFPVSEAKVSLVLTELEHQGKIEKIKKSKGNVILLKK